MIRVYFSVLSMIGLLLFSTGCKKDKVEANENEVITTVEIRLTESGAANPLVFRFKDADGPGGAAPQIDNVVLAANKTYNLQIVLLDETKNPAVNITEEVEEEGTVHRIYTLPSNGSGITVSNSDTDTNGLPVGISSAVTTAAAATGSLRVILRHYENGGKELADTETSSKSSTDVDVQFTTRVQ